MSVDIKNKSELQFIVDYQLENDRVVNSPCAADFEKARMCTDMAIKSWGAEPWVEALARAIWLELEGHHLARLDKGMLFCVIDSMSQEPAKIAQFVTDEMERCSFSDEDVLKVKTAVAFGFNNGFPEQRPSAKTVSSYTVA